MSSNPEMQTPVIVTDAILFNMNTYDDVNKTNKTQNRKKSATIFCMAIMAVPIHGKGCRKYNIDHMAQLVATQNAVSSRYRLKGMPRMLRRKLVARISTATERHARMQRQNQ